MHGRADASGRSGTDRIPSGRRIRRWVALASGHAASAPSPAVPPPNTLGLHRVMFAVDDLDDTLARLRPHGAELLRKIGNYQDEYRLCYLRGPAGIIVALAEQVG